VARPDEIAGQGKAGMMQTFHGINTWLPDPDICRGLFTTISRSYSPVAMAILPSAPAEKV
jgi:hypothetical protein